MALMTPTPHKRSWNVLSREPSGDRIARFCRHTAPDLTIMTEVKVYYRNMFWASGALSNLILCPEIKQKQAQDRKAHFETMSLPVAKILSPVVRQAPTKSRSQGQKFTLTFGDNAL